MTPMRLYVRANRFNPRLPGGRRPTIRITVFNFVKFQSTPSGGKATVAVAAEPGSDSQFQSTPSGGKATSHPSVSRCRAIRFNPRLPGGRRHGVTRRRIPPRSFNPRLPGGRRRCPAHAPDATTPVSIHAFRGEGDVCGVAVFRHVMVSIHAFRGEGDGSDHRCIPVATVSIHAFRGEGDSIVIDR